MKKIVLIICFIFCASLMSCNFAPGSYPYVELYSFKVSENTLLTAVDKFKTEDTIYRIPAHLRYQDGRKSEKDSWYHIWFYYAKENQVVKCWIRTGPKGNAELGFVGIGNEPDLNNFKQINKDFSLKDNRFQKKKFERLILNEIKKHIH